MKITLYVSDHCESCEQVLRYFKEKDLAYEVINVTYNQLMFDRMMSEGGHCYTFYCDRGPSFSCV
ncbi:arsenate reductase-like glutaredoxin family protein [Anoxybacillus calidus]|jgi:arsenate reductase-like glutaredoxin family protein|uniref:Arsenate reductase-like glutaredoxin family protein n=1 Tax=[Anoxybacillus] calidus TaxID=575178 RepID=A0A7V9Z2E4_9BACL|nr:arsenate reductase-like glutaredoxin family protein [Anoxybacillus calidus]